MVQDFVHPQYGGRHAFLCLSEAPSHIPQLLPASERWPVVQVLSQSGLHGNWDVGVASICRGNT